MVDGALDLVRVHRPLAQREHHAAHQLVAIEVGAAAVLLHEARHLQVDALVGREALFAPRALAAPAGGVRLEVRPGIDHLGFLGAAEGTLHGIGSSPGGVLTLCLAARMASIYTLPCHHPDRPDLLYSLVIVDYVHDFTAYY